MSLCTTWKNYSNVASRTLVECFFGYLKGVEVLVKNILCLPMNELQTL